MSEMSVSAAGAERSLKPRRSSFSKLVVFLLHLVSKSFDMGINIGPRAHWTQPITFDHTYGHSAHEPIWAGRQYHLPQLRHPWGDSQYELHAG